MNEKIFGFWVVQRVKERDKITRNKIEQEQFSKKKTKINFFIWDRVYSLCKLEYKNVENK